MCPDIFEQGFGQSEVEGAEQVWRRSQCGGGVSAGVELGQVNIPGIFKSDTQDLVFNSLFPSNQDYLNLVHQVSVISDQSEALINYPSVRHENQQNYWPHGPDLSILGLH